ncbi:hypothetical protein [Sporosarcina sp. NPDC096371]|uniref:hypothetical protein n=1 Tax=Sporosarcina sp. NPDC096371 TaxID=3364530 RepID=UPI0038150251
MAMGTKSIVATGIVVGGLTIGTLAFTGTDSLNKVGDYAKDFKDKIMNLDMSLTSWKDAFNNLKTDAEAEIAEANALISGKNIIIDGLKVTIAELEEQIALGSGNTEALTAEIERLSSELTRANNEVASLLAKTEAIHTEVASIGLAVEEAPAYKLTGIIDNGTVTTPPAFDVSSILSQTSQSTMKAMGIRNISNIKKDNASAVAIYADAGFDYNSSAVYNERIAFKNSVVPELLKSVFADTYNKQGTIAIYTHEGVLQGKYLNGNWSK